MSARGPSPLIRWLAAAALALAATAAAAAPEETVVLDSARSTARFSVKAMWMFNVVGKFGAVRGTVRIDRFRGVAVVSTSIDADDISMSRSGYESLVKSPEFFDVQAYPRIQFVSEPFSLQRLQRGGALPGEVTLRGITATVQFTMLPSTCARPAYDCPIELRGDLQRSQFGMRSRLGTISDKVLLDLRIFAVPDHSRLAP